jgi:hypothetical protein
MKVTKGVPRSHQIRVFLSHAQADSELARKLGRLLAERAGAQVFLAESLSAGEDWLARMRDELAEADAVVVLLTPKAVRSSWVLHEIGAAWALKKTIIAVASERRLVSSLPLAPESFRVFEVKDIDAPGANGHLLEELQDVLAGAHRV